MKHTASRGKVVLALCALGFVLVLPRDLISQAEGPLVPAIDEDMDGDGLSDEEERRIGTGPGLPDTDGDGLLDGWEVNGYFRHGQFEPLPVYGADPLRKDIFVEIDWMTTADDSTQVNAVIAYQAAIDVTRAFRRSGTGIEIHFDLGPRIEAHVPEVLREEGFDFARFQAEPDGEKVLPYQSVLPARPLCGGSIAALTLYEAYEGGRFFRPSRRNVFYYVVIAEKGRPFDAGERQEAWGSHPFTDSFSDELARRDGLRTAGVQVGVVSRNPMPDVSADLLRYHYSVSLFHELGHAFGLGHGGSFSRFVWDNNNFKPNYVSIMNYRYQLCGVDVEQGVPVMDLSHGRLRVPLYERSLLETVGMGQLAEGHILSCTGVERIGESEFPANIDWNGDGFISVEPVTRDLNENGRLDTQALSDHDDWSKLSRVGFDGIGLNAYRGCGMSCGRGNDIVELPGDYNGDGYEDLFLHRGDEIAWALSTGDGRLVIDPSASRRGALGNWPIRPGDNVVAGDFLLSGRDTIFCHRGTEVAIIDLNGGAPRLAWYEDGRIGNGSTDPPEGWRIGRSDRFLDVNFSGKPLSEIVVTNGRNLALLSAWGQEEIGLVEAWNPGPAMLEWTRREPASIRAGRDLAGVGHSFFIASPTSLIEVLGPIEEPNVRPLAPDGAIPGASADVKAWVLSEDDCIDPVDLDGEGVSELLVRRGTRLAVVRWSDGVARIAWSADDGLGAFPLSGVERVHVGQFVPGGGLEVLLVGAGAWATLGWNAASSSLEILAINESKLPGGDGWPLRRGQAVHVGIFQRGGVEGDQVLIQDVSSLAVARFTAGEGFRAELQFQGSVGEWLLSPGDILTPAGVDPDPELELLVRNGAVLGVIDLSTIPRSTFLAVISEDQLRFDEPPRFLRCDANRDHDVDISDAVTVLGNLFLGFQEPACYDAADADDNGQLNLSDAIFILSFLFNQGRAPPAPGAYRAGIDPTPDDLGCGP